MLDDLPSDYPQLLAELAELIDVRLRAQLSAHTALTLSHAIVEDIRERFSGELIYIPKYAPMETTLTREARNRAIAKEYDGTNCRELARRYGLTLNTVYAILRAMSKQ